MVTRCISASPTAGNIWKRSNRPNTKTRYRWRDGEKLNNQHGPKVYNTSDKTKGTRCDGCPSFEVLVRRKRYKDEESYWCTLAHGYINPFDCVCPKDGQKIKRIKPEFNRGWKKL